jgi:hypothetical protein
LSSLAGSLLQPLVVFSHLTEKTAIWDWTSSICPAAQFRQMATGARMVATVPALLRLADRYEALAEERKQEEDANQTLAI